MILESMSWAIWRNDSKLANKIIYISSFAAQHIGIYNGKVLPHSFQEFENLYIGAKQKFSQRERKDLKTQLCSAPVNKQKQIKSRIQAAKRLQGIWWPRKRRIQLSGLRLETPGASVPNILTSPYEVQTTLRDHWAPVYAIRPIDLDAAHKLLGVYRRRNEAKIEFEDVQLPDTDDYEDCITSARHSAPGRNGLPYIAWRAEKKCSAEALAGASDFLADQEIPEPGDALHNFLGELNSQDVVFAPKGIEEADKLAPTRAPQNLRTVFLCNIDYKLMAGATNRKINKPCVRLTPFNQRGGSFV